MTRWAAWLVAIAGLRHTLGSLIETLPHQWASWVDGSLWTERDYADQSDAAAGFWYSMFSFGPPTLLLGLMLNWMHRHGMTPPRFIAWSIAGWVVVTFLASGPFPLLLLLLPAAMMALSPRRWRKSERQPHPSHSG